MKEGATLVPGQDENTNDTLLHSTYVLVDVKEGGHDGILDGSQIGLVPVDVEHPPDAVAASAITGDVLQEEGLLTAVGRDKGAGIRKGIECNHFL